MNVFTLVPICAVVVVRSFNSNPNSSSGCQSIYIRELKQQTYLRSRTAGRWRGVWIEYCVFGAKSEVKVKVKVKVISHSQGLIRLSLHEPSGSQLPELDQVFVP